MSSDDEFDSESIGEEFSSSDESISEDELLQGSDEEDSQSDDGIEEFEQGLTVSNRLKVKQARKLYFEDKQKGYNSVVAKEVSQKVKDKWTDILDRVGDSSNFDFNILKSLTNQSTTETTNTNQELDIKQQGDDWDYTIGLKEEIEQSLNSIDDKEEIDDSEDEEITDED